MSVRQPEDWQDKRFGMLWVYNLHYMDFLGSEGVSRETKHNWINRWIDDNPPGQGHGWEPYPISLRVVNWIKCLWTEPKVDEKVLQSLALQLKTLERNIEYHLLANHLFTNAKTLTLGGVFFGGKDGDRWLRVGLRLLSEEIPGQILEDGAYYERSPMYHSIILEDCLDLWNGLNVLDESQSVIDEGLLNAIHTVKAFLASRIPLMLQWLGRHCHPDGKIALFADSALGIAPDYTQLEDYTRRLGLAVLTVPEVYAGLSETSGYYTYRRRDICLIANVGTMGPSYQPGHAHADSLAFECSVTGRRVFVDAGVSTYSDKEQRAKERSTAVHNTLSVDGLDSSEVWGAHRVGRRAKVEIETLDEDAEQVCLLARHNGYTHLSGVGWHQRRWKIRGDGFVVIDSIKVGPGRCVATHWLFHPDVEVELQEGRVVLNISGVKAIWALAWPHTQVAAQLDPAEYASEFGLVQKTHRLTLHWNAAVESVDCTFHKVG